MAAPSRKAGSGRPTVHDSLDYSQAEEYPAFPSEGGSETESGYTQQSFNFQEKAGDASQTQVGDDYEDEYQSSLVERELEEGGRRSLGTDTRHSPDISSRRRSSLDSRNRLGMLHGELASPEPQGQFSADQLSADQLSAEPTLGRSTLSNTAH